MTTVMTDDGLQSDGSGGESRRRFALPRPPGRRRNRSAVIVGLLLVVGCGAAGVALYTSATERPLVLAVGRDVPAGGRITAGDLTNARVASDPPVRPIPASARSRVVGRVARVGLVPGDVLTPAHLARSDAVPTGQSVVAVVLDFGQAPKLVPGDRVLVVAPAQNLSAGAQVFAVDRQKETDGDVRVSLLADEPTAARIATAAVSRGEMSLVLRATEP